jgi:anthranilate synthase/aminodeoxychorismate synthase-like glutamine amidotransferase
VEHDRVAAGDLAGHTHVVLSAGPGRPDDPADFALGRAVFELGLPVLGVCLGMQAMVVAFGGAVERAAPAHGELAEIAHDGRGVFAGVPARFRAVRYHSLQAVRLPDSLEVTATCAEGAGCGRRAVMAVRHRSLPLEGVQFHPESVLSEHGELLVRNFLGRG